MKAKTLWQVKITVPPLLEDAASELLAGLLNAPASAYTDQETGRTDVSVYLEAAPPKEIKATLAAAMSLAGLETGRDPAPAKVDITKLPARDWADYWKRHFKPVRVGRAFLIKPSWDKTKPHPGQVAIVMDPGLSFGTGHHPTTLFCLRQIAHQYLIGGGENFLDIGTGTGILAIAAAQLGYRRIEAFDFDPDSVRVAKANARINGVAGRIKFCQADLTQQPESIARPFSFVCANLTADLLLSQQAKLIGRVRPGGWLSLAGILAAQFPEVSAAYQAAGFALRRQAVKGEWQSGLFTRRG
jgi:ribosomal protein L11 methyltransferase